VPAYRVAPELASYFGPFAGEELISEDIRLMSSAPSPFAPPRNEPEASAPPRTFPADFPVEIPHVRGELILRYSGPWKGTQLMLDGAPLKPKWGKFLLPIDDGGTVKAQMNAFDLRAIVPTLKVGETVYRVGPQIPAALGAYAYLPILLLFVGGALGGALGALGAGLNRAVTQMAWPLPVRVLVMTLVTLGSYGAFAIAAALLSLFTEK
jgi:hypothetical protein